MRLFLIANPAPAASMSGLTPPGKRQPKLGNLPNALPAISKRRSDLYC